MENLLKFLPSRPQPLLVRWGATTVVVSVFLLLWLGSDRASGGYNLIFFIPPVLLAAILFDRASSFLAIGLCTLGTALTLDWQTNVLHRATALTLFVVVSAFAALVGDTMRGALERQQAAQQDAELLLQEQGHRIKNELAIASSLLMLQAKAARDDSVRQALETAVARLHVIAKSHDHFRIRDSDEATDMQEYLGEICGNAGEALRGVRAITVEVDAERVVARSQKATRIGLIVNELVTNALKHAFPGDAAGSVRVMLRRASSELVLIVQDNGIGYPRQPAEGLGSRLTRLLVQQLGGHMKRELAEPGCRVTITIPTIRASLPPAWVNRKGSG